MAKLIQFISYIIFIFTPALSWSYSGYDQAQELKTTKSITDFKKAKYQIVYFWASWCPDCKEKLRLDLSKYQTAETDFVTLSIEDNKNKVVKFSDKENVKYPVFYDPNRQLQKDLKIFTVPTVVLVQIVDGKPVVLENVSGTDWSKIDMAIKGIKL